ncbi:MAG: DNA cytosine methyltransferase [Oscillospiraceae bacterium]|nr:DNA cytosine methyltransferase [Oscillospiraceae bacterium]
MNSIIDLFSGCGGMSLGFEHAGFKVLLGIDNDSMALHTFESNHKEAKTLCDDITQVGYSKIKEIIGEQAIDVIIGGPPCQGMSLSGFRNYDDPRNRLYLSYIRLVKEIQPKAFVIENVPGLAALFGGAIKDSILEEFSKLGYSVKYKILVASDYGVPQRRKRIIFVGIKGNINNFIFPDPFGCEICCEMALSDLPPLNGAFLGSEIQEYMSTPLSNYQTLMRKNSEKVYNHIAAEHSERVKEIISLVPNGGNYKDLPEEFKQSRNFHVAWTRFNRNKTAPTIDTGHRHHFHYEYNRVPTVRECARLQSFPDDFIFYGNKTQQFRQVGNAVPPLMAQAIAESLKNYLEEGNNVYST